MIDLCLRHRLGPVEGTMLLDISRLRTAAQDVNRQIGPEAFADLKDDFKVVGTTDVVGTVRREKGTTAILGGPFR